MAALTIGVDAGGTATRAALVGAGGAVLGRGRAGSGNPVAVGLPAASAALREAVASALGGHRPAEVCAAVAGVAGYGALRPNSYAGVWRSLGLSCPLWIVPDAVVAFASGSATPDGVVLVAGTGAVAARVTGWRLATVADGLGWLLGDEGSAYWLGRTALRTAATAMQAGQDSLLADALRAGAGAAPASAEGSAQERADAFVTWVYGLSRGQIAALAPVVVRLAGAGDRAAARIVRLAAGRLTGTLAALGPPEGSVVLAGGVLAADSPVTAAVVAAVVRRWSVVPTLAGDGALGAARLARLRC